MPYSSDLSKTGVTRPQALPPQLALLFYGDIILKHPVLDTEAGYELGAGATLSPDDLNALGELLARQGVIRTRANTLGCGVANLIWWVPPGVRPLHFDAKYEQTRSIARLSGVPVPHPGLVLAATASELRVFAVRGPERPDDTTRLYHAPFWNIFQGGRMCQGTVRYPRSLQPAAQEAWEDAFFNSVFTGPSRQDKYLNWGRSYEELLERAIHDGTFPEDVLIESRLTLGDLLDGKSD